MERLQRFAPTQSVLLRIVLSVILAVLLWGWVTSLADPQSTRSQANVPISPGAPADGLVVSTTSLTANVVATGPRSAIEKLTSSGMALTLDLDGITEPGKYTVPIVPVNKERFVDYRITPPTASIVVDELDTVVVQLTPNQTSTSTTSGSDRQAASIKLSSPEVTISGPKSIVSTITSAGVDIDTTGQTGTFTVRGETYAVTDQGNRIDASSGTITISPPFVNATVDMQSRGKELTILPNVTGQPAAGYEQRITTTTPRTVIVDGPADALDRLNFVGTEPVDITGASESVSRTVNVTGLPNGVRVIQPSNGQVTVIVQVQQQNVDQTLPSLPVQVAGLGAGLTATVNPGSVSIEIAASSDQVPSLVNGGIVISVDVSGRGPGTYTLVPRVTVPSGVEWDSISPQTVVVTISAGGSATPSEATPGISAPTAATPAAFFPERRRAAR